MRAAGTGAAAQGVFVPLTTVEVQSDEIFADIPWRGSHHLLKLYENSAFEMLHFSSSHIEQRKHKKYSTTQLLVIFILRDLLYGEGSFITLWYSAFNRSQPATAGHNRRRPVTSETTLSCRGLSCLDRWELTIKWFEPLRITPTNL